MKIFELAFSFYFFAAFQTKARPLAHNHLALIVTQCKDSLKKRQLHWLFLDIKNVINILEKVALFKNKNYLICYNL